MSSNDISESQFRCATLKSRMARQRLIVPTMTGSSPISIQAKGEPAPIVPAGNGFLEAHHE